jgi:hypothetical protein
MRKTGRHQRGMVSAIRMESLSAIAGIRTLGDCEPGQERVKYVEWEAKGVTPILYEVPKDSHDHSALHGTLKAWAEIYRDGVLGKERIVVDYALARPSSSTKQDDFVSRMLWALSHDSGLPAKRFADFNPVPPIEWLEALSEDRLKHGDLNRFGVPPRSEIDDNLCFSLIRRPAPYECAPRMSLVSGRATDIQWDDVMSQLARWLVRHLNDPVLIIWLAQRGGQLHEKFSWLIEHELNRYSALEQDGKTAELDEIRSNSPNAIPHPFMKTLWRLLLIGRVKSPWRDVDLYRWKDQFKRDGMTAASRMKLRVLLAPKLVLKKPFNWGEVNEEAVSIDRLKQFVDWELVLAADHAHSSLRDLDESVQWRSALPTLLDDFQMLLRDALDLLRELGEANDHSDRSHWDIPSIGPHWQNRGFHDWITLIELLRDAWLVTRETAFERAKQIALGWFSLPYPAFKRLAFFAASFDGCVAPDQWVDWLLFDSSWWLWSSDTRREIMRLLVLQSSHLPLSARARLEAAILAGPLRSMYRDDIELDRWQSLVDHSVWLHLAKLRESNQNLGVEAMKRFSQLSAANLEWKLASNERDEFSHWMSGTGDSDYEDSRDIDIAPRKRKDILNWLKQPGPAGRPFYEDTWRETCRTRFFHCAYALCDLAREGRWPIHRWREAMQAWSEDGQTLRSWRFAAPIVQTMPDEILLELSHSLTWWLESVSKLTDQHEIVLLNLCRRVMDLSHQVEVDTEQQVTRAINHPIGHVTQALLNFWFKREPNDNEGLPVNVEPFFSRLCDGNVEQFRHGRVLLASRLIALFRVDQPWTETHLLPLFDWKTNQVEAKAAWEGFLWSPRLYRPLLIAFKANFLSTAQHYADLGEHNRQFAAFLTYAALDPVASYTPQDFRIAIDALPQEGLQEAAQALSQALEGAGDQREDYWKNRIQPFWQLVWPKSRELTSSNIAESLARMSIAGRGEFPSALSAIIDWLRPIEHPHYLVHLLYTSGLATRFPLESLRLLNAVLDSQRWVPDELVQCLKAISQASPDLLQDHRYQRLDLYARRSGG